MTYRCMECGQEIKTTVHSCPVVRISSTPTERLYVGTSGDVPPKGSLIVEARSTGPIDLWCVECGTRYGRAHLSACVSGCTPEFEQCYSTFQGRFRTGPRPPVITATAASAGPNDVSLGEIGDAIAEARSIGAVQPVSIIRDHKIVLCVRCRGLEEVIVVARRVIDCLMAYSYIPPPPRTVGFTVLKIWGVRTIVSPKLPIEDIPDIYDGLQALIDEAVWSQS